MPELISILVTCFSFTLPVVGITTLTSAHLRRLNSTFVVAGKSQIFYVCIVCKEGKCLDRYPLVKSLLDTLESGLISISYKLPNSNRFQWVIFNELMRCLFESNKETLLKQYTVHSNQLWQLFAPMQIQDIRTSEVPPNVFLGWLRFIVSLFASASID